MQALDLAETVARRRGFKTRRTGNRLVIEHPEAPFTIVVEQRDRDVSLSLVAENLRDYIEDVYESEEDPRGYLESILDDVTALATEVTTTLERKGFRVTSRRLREVVMDALEILEEVEEA
jgi:hypothetical protein